MDDETGPTTSALGGKIQRADAAMKRSADLIAQEANAGGKTKKGGRERTRKILTNVEQVVSVLEGLAELHPIAKAVVKEFKAVLRLELDRRENNEQIVAVCHSMTTMVYALRFIASRADEDEELHEQLTDAVGQMEEVILDFGKFCDLYYNRCKYRIVRFLRGTQFKGQLSSFVQQFSQHQHNIEFILTAQSINRGIQTSENMVNVLANTSTIIARMDAIQTAAEKAAAALVEARGGAEEVCGDADAVREVARKLGTAPGDDPEPVTSVTLELLSTSLEDLLIKNQDRFEMKLESAKLEIEENVARMAGVILKKLDEGPHELIGDLDVKEMWKANGWRISVKARYFVDALYNHFSQKFGAAMLAGEDVADEWTLKVFARIVNHPAVGEAVDEDASGFVSLHEVNHFVSRKPENITTPVWFAFWAVGWRYLNVLYTDAIVSMLNDIEALCEKAKSGVDSDDLDGCVDTYLESCKLLRVQLSWLTLADGGHDEILDDMDEEARGQLQSYAVEISEVQEAAYDHRLNGVEYVLDDIALLPNIVGSSNVRIEQVFLSLIYVILRRQIVFITENTDASVEANEDNVDRFVHLWGTMDATLWTLLVEYHHRTKSLMRSWRSQKEDVDIEVHCYAGGLLYGWYLTYQQPGNLIKKWMEREQGEAPVEESPAHPITILQTKVSALDDRISNIEKMLKQLLAASGNAAAPNPTQTEAEGEAGEIPAVEDDEPRRFEGDDYDGGEQYGDE